ncbi:MAG TPA: isoprenylcysteine carboxylmethyltransferase family protein, partial [Bacteroidota bacterium]|nr:isoprenylcysteine carboxylmethyltransferase family protein [Bacteroidota bacterium]
MREGPLFIVISLPLVWISRRSLRAPGSHGFYRFFAWEAIAILIVLNIPYWFEDPLSGLQVLSWAVLLVSLWLASAAFKELRNRGGAVPVAEGDPNFRFENTTRLVTGGIYGRIRHPAYSSLLFLAWGACLKHLSAEGLLAAVFASVFLFFTARIEEEENLRKFGAAYRVYMGRCGMFLPSVHGLRSRRLT